LEPAAAALVAGLSPAFARVEPMIAAPSRAQKKSVE